MIVECEEITLSKTGDEMEKDFLISQGSWDVHCKLSEPEDGRIRRLVLSVHGLGGSTDDQIQEGIAQEMALFDSVTIRFDFPGHGKSPLDGSHFTLANCMDSLLTVARFARQRYPDIEDLCIFATGFGAYVTLICLDQLLELPGRIKLVIQTPSISMDRTLLAMNRISRETLWAMDRIAMGTKRPLEITYQLYEELHEHNALAVYPIPILILHGEADDFIPIEEIHHFRQINDQAKLVIIPGTSHRFIEEGAWDMVLDLTRDWFEFEQVLLADCE